MSASAPPPERGSRTRAALAGRTDLDLLASTGALSALYLSARSRRERLRRLPLVQLGRDPWALAATRVLDTAIGCAIALMVLVVDRRTGRLRRR